MHWSYMQIDTLNNNLVQHDNVDSSPSAEGDLKTEQAWVVLTPGFSRGKILYSPHN